MKGLSHPYLPVNYPSANLVNNFISISELLKMMKTLHTVIMFIKHECLYES